MTISLRNLPPEVSEAIEDTSRRESISLNKATIRLLEAPLRKPARNTDFDEFCGIGRKLRQTDSMRRCIKMRHVDLADWDLPGRKSS